MRRAGDVCHANINRDGTGEVEFATPEDLKYAVRSRAPMTGPIRPTVPSP